LQENFRVSEKLYSTQKVTRDAVYRAEAELSTMTQNILEAENNLDLSRSYLNFLLNRTLDDSVTIDKSILQVKNYDIALDSAHAFAQDHREDINQLESAIEVTQNRKSIVKSNFAPGLSAVVDYGFQGESYKFSPDDDYWMASLVLEWNIFRGFQDQARMEQAAIETKKLEARLEELKNQLRLQVRQAYNEFMLAHKKIEVAEQRKRSSEFSFEIINKKYQQGMAAMIEFLDARSNLTQAQINLILANYDYHRSYAELERVTSYYKLSDMEKDDEE
jgi:outer membrane protein